MNIEKNKISWFFFAIYVIAYLYVGVCIGNAMSRMLNLGATALSCIIVVMVILLAFVGCAAALVVLIKARPKNSNAVMRRRRRALRNDVFFVREVLPALASYLLVVVSRGVYIVQFSGGKLSGNVGMYERITSGAGVDFGNFFGIGRLYALLMRGFCILLGNVPDAVYILNLICQVIFVFSCYLFLRMAAGRAAAVSSSVLFLCIPYFYRAISICEPEQLFMALCAAAACILTAVMKRSVFDIGGKGMVPAYFLCGLFFGMLFMLDLTALLIPVTVIVLFFTTVRGRRAELLLFVLGVIAGMFAGTWLLSLALPGTQAVSEKMLDDFSNYMTYYENALCAPTLFLEMPQDLVLMCVIAFGGIAAVLFFWSRHDVLRVIAVPYFGMILFGRTGSGFVLSCMGVLTAAMTVGIIYLIGQPVEDVYASVRRKNTEEGQEAEGGEESPTQTQKEENSLKEVKKERRLKPEKAGKEAKTKKEKSEKKKEKAQKSEEKEAKKEKEAQKKEEKGVKEAETKKIEEEQSIMGAGQSVKKETVMEKKTRFIENPLPLPKKREHREMDYAYEVSADRMHFDIEVHDQDDFDC